MDDPAYLFLALGALFIAGLAADTFGRRTHLPRVTLLILIGIVAGPSGTGLIANGTQAWFELVSTAALAIVAFLLGNALTRKKLAAHGREILVITGILVAATLAIMTAGLTAVGLDPGLALVLAAIGTATAPAATVDILSQARASGPFADRIRGIVAVDDAWGLIVFSLALVVVSAAGGNGAEASASPLWHGVRDLGGALLVGLATGLPAAYLTGRLSPGEPMQSEALGTVFLTAGLAAWLGVSVLLAGITAGAVVANLARHHERPFHEIEHVEWPFMLVFFLLAGASLDVAALPELGMIGLAFVVLRTLARLLGGWLGGLLADLPPVERRWIGPALLPQAGVAVGMALVAGEAFPDWRETILTLTVGTTVIFELLGPPATLLALSRVRDQSARPGSRII
jgi:Kef-type K+ transport system membrane component KefB